MTVSETIIKMLLFCSENKIIFNLTKNGDENEINFVDIPKKTLNVNIPNYKDENLGELLTSKLTELKNLAK